MTGVTMNEDLKEREWMEGLIISNIKEMQFEPVLENWLLNNDAVINLYTDMAVDLWRKGNDLYVALNKSWQLIATRLSQLAE